MAKEGVVQNFMIVRIFINKPFKGHYQKLDKDFVMIIKWYNFRIFLKPSINTN